MKILILSGTFLNAPLETASGLKHIFPVITVTFHFLNATYAMQITLQQCNATETPLKRYCNTNLIPGDLPKEKPNYPVDFNSRLSMSLKCVLFKGKSNTRLYHKREKCHGSRSHVGN